MQRPSTTTTTNRFLVALQLVAVIISALLVLARLSHGHRPLRLAPGPSSDPGEATRRRRKLDSGLINILVIFLITFLATFLANVTSSLFTAAPTQDHQVSVVHGDSGEGQGYRHTYAVVGISSAAYDGNQHGIVTRISVRLADYGLHVNGARAAQR